MARLPPTMSAHPPDSEESLMRVASSRRRLSPICRRVRREAAAAMWAKSPEKTAAGRFALASASVARAMGAAADMVEARALADQPGSISRRAHRPGQLPEEEGEELALRVQPTDAVIGPVLIHKPVEDVPRICCWS